MYNSSIIQSISKDLAIELPFKTSEEVLHKILSTHINLLIKNNFEALVSILYRMDVNELKLKQLLKNNATKNAGDIIATLIIERQFQKIKTKQSFKQKNNAENDTEEKW